MMCSLATLDEAKLTKVKELEGRLGKTLLAFSCGEMDADALDEGALTQIKETEDTLGIALVAVK